MSTKQNFVKALKEITGFDEAPAEKPERQSQVTQSFKTPVVERVEREVPRPQIRENSFSESFSKSYKQIARDDFGTATEIGKTNIPKGMKVIGNIESKDRIEMLGRVEGDITTTGDAVLTGAVVGNIEANNLLLQEGAVKGNLSAKGDVVIDRGAVVIGNVGAHNLKLNGKVKGDISVEQTAELTSAALVNGNIETSIISTSVGTRIRGSIITRHTEGFDEDDEFNIEV